MNQVAVANPEAIINAAVAANAAAGAAYQAFILAWIILGAVLIIGAMMCLVAIKFSELEQNTNSMKDALVDATRKLALIEGNVIGRQELAKEETETSPKVPA